LKILDFVASEGKRSGPDDMRVKSMESSKRYSISKASNLVLAS
jgi:hypothetical protein